MWLCWLYFRIHFKNVFIVFSNNTTFCVLWNQLKLSSPMEISNYKIDGRVCRFACYARATTRVLALRLVPHHTAHTAHKSACSACSLSLSLSFYARAKRQQDGRVRFSCKCARSAALIAAPVCGAACHVNDNSVKTICASWPQSITSAVAIKNSSWLMMLEISRARVINVLSPTPTPAAHTCNVQFCTLGHTPAHQLRSAWWIVKRRSLIANQLLRATGLTAKKMHTLWINPRAERALISMRIWRGLSILSGRQSRFARLSVFNWIVRPKWIVLEIITS